MIKQSNTNLALQSARETWTAYVIVICLLFILSLLSTLISKGDFTFKFFGAQTYRIGNTTELKIGRDALMGFLLVLPTIAAGLTIYRSKK